MRRFIGILIVFVGGVLALTALLGFSIDEKGLLVAVQAPAFEPALNVLLESHHTIFTIASFALVFFILICSVIALAKGSTHMGFTIMVAALCAGFSAWPHGTPFMLIVIFGAHWIAVAEMREHEMLTKISPPPSAAPTASSASVPNSAPPTTEPNNASPTTEPAGDGVAASHPPESGNGNGKGKGGFLKQLARRFFH